MVLQDYRQRGCGEIAGAADYQYGPGFFVSMDMPKTKHLSSLGGSVLLIDDVKRLQPSSIRH